MLLPVCSGRLLLFCFVSSVVWQRCEPVTKCQKMRQFEVHLLGGGSLNRKEVEDCFTISQRRSLRIDGPGPEQHRGNEWGAKQVWNLHSTATLYRKRSLACQCKCNEPITWHQPKSIQPCRRGEDGLLTFRWSVKFKKGILVTLNVAWMLLSERLVWVFPKLLIDWGFHTGVSISRVDRGWSQKERISSEQQCLADVRGQNELLWGWLETTERQQYHLGVHTSNLEAVYSSAASWSRCIPDTGKVYLMKWPVSIF